MPGPDARERRLRYSTGNEFLVLDEIETSGAAVRDFTFLYEAARGTIVLGGEDGAFLQPRVSVDGQPVDLGVAEWRLINHWIPSFTLSTPAGVLECIYLSPVARKGFAVRMTFHATRRAEVELGLDLSWTQTLHVCDNIRQMQGARFCGYIGGRIDEPFLSLRAAWPLFAIGIETDPGSCELRAGDRAASAETPEVQAGDTEAIQASCSRAFSADLAQVFTFDTYFGIGLEASSAVASARDLQATGWDGLLSGTSEWLETRRIRCKGEVEPLAGLLNENALYNHFFSHGVTIDTERMIVTSSRSARYDYTGSYRDRDACLYSVPGVLMIDPQQARRMLEYIFNVQVRNVGARSRYMDGVLMRPGLGLDSLVSPIRALWMYVDLTNDLTLLFDQSVQSGINQILQNLAVLEHETTALYRTQLTPSESRAQLPYVTFDNILAWRALLDLSDLYHRIRDVERQSETSKWAHDVRAAILANCIVEGPNGAVFCHSTDLSGRQELGDEPEGSLLLAAHLELCREDLAAFRNTAAWIARKSEADSPERQCVLSLANRLLAGDKGPVEMLKTASLDQGIAPGWLDSSGCALAGTGWAASAGYLAYALVRTFEDQLDPPVTRSVKERSARISRTVLRPGVGWI